MNLQHYQNTPVPQDATLLGEDMVTFSVLGSILQNPCSDIFTNHKSVILCFSAAPYPVWVWCKDSSNTDDVQKIADCLKQYFPLESGFSYNIGYDLLYALQQMDSYFENVEFEIQMLTYQLNKINDTARRLKGSIAPAREDELEELCKLYNAMHKEMQGYDFDYDHCKADVLNFLNKNALFAMRDENGSIVALTSRWDEGNYSKVSNVYTLPHARRKGYANNLVHYVTQTILNDGLIPTLYTDANYGASNECYQKIGYEQVGSLCTITIKKEKK